MEKASGGKGINFPWPYLESFELEAELVAAWPGWVLGKGGAILRLRMKKAASATMAMMREMAASGLECLGSGEFDIAARRMAWRRWVGNS
jgi:hypothetical protein